LASKKVAVVGVNQLRDVPMAMYGPSESEPCGKALKYNSDVRLRWYPRSLSAVPLWPEQAKKGGGEVEAALGGGKDKYKYINVQAAKNKLSEGGRETWIRLWTKDEHGVAHGIDPVFDTIYYLWQTGQLVSAKHGGKRKALKLILGKEESKVCTWHEIKSLILGDKKQMIATCKSLGIKPRNLRSWCFKQMASGEGERLFKKMERSGETSAKPVESDAEDED
jgi:hypothetical protein